MRAAHRHSTSLAYWHSDFIWDLGKEFKEFLRILAKLHKNGEMKAIFGLGMTPLNNVNDDHEILDAIAKILQTMYVTFCFVGSG